MNAFLRRFRKGPEKDLPRAPTLRAPTREFQQEETHVRDWSIFVVAIDIGTTYSGWACSCRDDYIRDPINISTKLWPGNSFVSQKGPTCILIKPDGSTTDSFGYDAEDKYAAMLEVDVKNKWFYFERFKMMLHVEEGINRETFIVDATGKQLSALTVFSKSIEFLKSDVLCVLNKRLVGDGIPANDIHWVLTVPAIWNDAAKQFMREAARSAGIPDETLTICLEPEAASIYCCHLPVSNESGIGDNSSLCQFAEGTKYIVLDAGGGTVDITVHEITTDRRLKEVYMASGGAWGGTKVDAEFESFLIHIVGNDVMETFKTTHVDDYIDLFGSFELKKRKISATNEDIVIRVPLTLSTLCTDVRGQSLQDLLLETNYEHITFNLENNKMRMNSEVFNAFFQPSINSIIEHIASLLKRRPLRGCEAMLMVGGFSSSPLLQESVKEHFPILKLIVPKDAELAVLKGAVIFGHEPRTITVRVCRFTYGTHASHRYSELCNHPTGRTERDENGDMRCYDLFCIHAKVGQSVNLDEEQQEIVYKPVSDDLTLITFDIYASPSEQPNFVTEKDCRKIGELSIPIQDTSLGRGRQFGVSFIFGGTEIRIKVTDKSKKQVTYTSANFLG